MMSKTVGTWGLRPVFDAYSRVFISFAPQSDWGLSGDRVGTVGTGQKTRNGGNWGLGDRNGDYSFRKLFALNMLCLRSPVPTVPTHFFKRGR
jgi:hypothetical protein